MSIEFKTLTFPNTEEGRQDKIRELQWYSNQGWEVVSETITQGSFRGGRAFCLSILICLPAAFCAGRSDGEITVTLKRDTSSRTSVPSNSRKTYEPVICIETDALIKRAFLFFEDGEIYNAERYIEQALNQDPENPQVYMAKLMLEYRVKSPVELLNKLKTPLEEEKLFQRALRFAGEEYKSQLRSYAQASRDKLEQERLARETELERIRLEKEAEKEALYQKIMVMKSTASTVSEFEEVLRLISSIRPYKDTKELYTEVSKALYTEKDYQRALETKKKAHELEDFRSLVYTLEQLNGYKDSELLLTEAREALNKAEQHERKKKVVKVIAVIILALAVFAYFLYSRHSEQLAQEQKQAELAQRREVQDRQPIRAEKAFSSARELELSEAYVQARQYYRQAVELAHPESAKIPYGS